MVYEPQEDSALLALHVQRLARGRVLDMGTGSGVLAAAAARSRRVSRVLAVDVDKKAISCARQDRPNKKITYRISNLFSGVHDAYDTIVCNPPYLPGEQGLKDPALVGGKHGYEWICRFLSQAVEHLRPKGQILMVYSSLSKPARIQECARGLLLDSQELDKQHIFFEDILVMHFSPSRLRIQLEKGGFQRLSYFARGKRGWILTATWRGKQVAVKIKNPSSLAPRAIANETAMLRMLNRAGIGPRLVKATMHYVAYQFVEGSFILDFLERASRHRIRKVLSRVLEQCRIMDELGISKEEMTRPVKHILVTKGDKPVLIDFERAHKTKKPHNVTQCCQFLTSGYTRFVLGSKGIRLDPARLRKMAGMYKQQGSKRAFQDIGAYVLGKPVRTP